MSDCNCLKEASVVNINCEYCTVKESPGRGCGTTPPVCGCGCESGTPMPIDAGSGWTCERCMPTRPAPDTGCGCRPAPVYGCGFHDASCCAVPMTSCCDRPTSVIPECGAGNGCGCR